MGGTEEKNKEEGVADEIKGEENLVEIGEDNDALKCFFVLGFIFDFIRSSFRTFEERISIGILQ